MYKVVCGLALSLVGLSASSCASDSPVRLSAELDGVEAKVLEHEELIAECMEQRGWEYIPALPADMYLERAAVLAEAEGRRFDASAVSIPENPNDEIVARLSEAEQEARANDYWGSSDGRSDEGCYHLTYEDAWGVDPSGPDPEFIADLEKAIASDSRVAAARTDYVGCMAQRGIEVDAVDEVIHEYARREYELRTAIEAQSRNPDDSSEMDMLLAEKAQAFETHDECVKAFRETENLVHQEYLREHGSGL